MKNGYKTEKLSEDAQGQLAVTLVILAVVSIVGLIWYSNYDPEKENKELSKAQVTKIVEILDARTNGSGVYDRPTVGDVIMNFTTSGNKLILESPDGKLSEADSWGNNLTVLYTQGGFREDVSVRSFGPDGISHTKDDIIAKRHSVNMKGIGNGLKKNTEEFSENTTRGATKGIVQGLKEEGVLGHFTGKFKKKDEE